MSIRSDAGAIPQTSTRVLAGVLSLAMGAFLVWGAGFASADALHDTAHDARHAMGLPCH